MYPEAKTLQERCTAL